MHKGLLWIFAPGPRHPIRCRRRARALLSDASDVTVHLAERAIDVANPSIEVAALDLNRHATFGARQRWATPKLADSVRNGRAAVAVEVDLLVVEVKPALRAQAARGLIMSNSDPSSTRCHVSPPGWRSYQTCLPIAMRMRVCFPLPRRVTHG
jgi:hypothetical protein